MLSNEHEAIVQLLRERPQDIPELIQQVTTLPALKYTVRIVESVVSQTVNPALSADLVALVYDGSTPAFVAVIEYQREIDPEKRNVWPMYTAALHRTHQCPVSVVVVTRDATVAQWAARPIALGPGSTIAPVVLGPSDVRKVSSLDEAKLNPVLTVLSGLVHGDNSQDLAPLYAAFSAVKQFPSDMHKLLNAVLFYGLSRRTQGVISMV